MKGIAIKTIIVIVSFGLCLSAGRTIFDFWQRKDVVKDREKELETLQSQNQTLERKLIDIQQDTYMERVARDELGLVKEGETIIIVPDVDHESQQENAVLPRWKRWWKLFF